MLTVCSGNAQLGQWHADEDRVSVFSAGGKIKSIQFKCIQPYEDIFL